MLSAGEFVLQFRHFLLRRIEYVVRSSFPIRGRRRRAVDLRAAFQILHAAGRADSSTFDAQLLEQRPGYPIASDREARAENARSLFPDD